MAGPQRSLPQSTIGSGTINDPESGFFETRARRKASEFNKRLAQMTPEQRAKQFEGMQSSRQNVMRRQGRIDPELLQSRPEDADAVWFEEDAKLASIRSPRDPYLKSLAEEIRSDENLQQSISKSAEARETGPYSGELGGFSEPAIDDSLPDDAATRLAEATGMPIEKAKLALGITGKSTGVSKKVASGPMPGEPGSAGQDPSDPMDIDPTDDKQVLEKARMLAFGKNSPFEKYGEIQATAMSEIAKSQNRLKQLKQESMDAGLRITNLNDATQAERIIADDFAQTSRNEELALKLEQEQRKKESYEEVFGKEGIATKWMETKKRHIDNIQATSHIDEDGAFGFSTWGETFRTIGAVVAMGAQVAGKIALEKKGLGSALPNIVMPLIMKAIDADIRRDENAYNRARQEGLEHSGLVDDFLKIYDKKDAAIDAVYEVGISAARARLSHFMALLPGTPDGEIRKQYYQVITDGLNEEARNRELSQLERFDALEKSFLASSLDSEGAIRSARSAQTARGLSMMNAYKVLNAKGEEKTDKLVWGNLEKESEKSERAFMSRAREIKALASAVIAESGGEFGSIEQIALMSIQEITDRFGDDMPPGLTGKLSQLESLMQTQITAFAKTFENKLTEGDIQRYKEILGSLKTASLINVLANHSNAEYAVMESYLTRMAIARNSGDYDRYYNAFVNVVGNPEEALARYEDSIRARLEMGEAGALKRLDVGLIPFKISLQQGQEMSNLTKLEIERRINEPAKGSFRSDFDHVREEARRRAGNRQKAKNDSAAPAKVSLTGMPTTPGGNSQPKKEANNYTAPLANMKLTSKFNKPGEFRTYRGKRSRHKGADFKASVGTALYSPFNGKILEAKMTGDKTPNGNYIRMEDTKTGYEWTFIHLDKFDKSLVEGKMVPPGFVLGATGKSGKGNVDPHLHIQVKDRRGNVIDPEPLLAQYLGNR